MLQGESKEFYEFVDPVIEGISPVQGPRSGGTLLTIRGRYMNAGSSIQVIIVPILLGFLIFSFRPLPSPYSSQHSNQQSKWIYSSRLPS